MNLYLFFIVGALIIFLIYMIIFITCCTLDPFRTCREKKQLYVNLSTEPRGNENNGVLTQASSVYNIPDDESLCPFSQNRISS